MVVNGDRMRVLAERDPAKLPWKDLGVDVVMECTGFFASQEKASLHVQGGAKKVLISAPAKGDIDATVVFGVNDGHAEGVGHGHLERVVHDQLPRADGQGPARVGRRRVGA